MLLIAFDSSAIILTRSNQHAGTPPAGLATQAPAPGRGSPGTDFLEVFVQELNEASQANEMTRDEAERSNLAIKAGILSIRALLLDMRDN